jgi:hypothetical protein
MKLIVMVPCEECDGDGFVRTGNWVPKEFGGEEWVPSKRVCRCKGKPVKQSIEVVDLVSVNGKKYARPIAKKVSK